MIMKTLVNGLARALRTYFIIYVQLQPVFLSERVNVSKSKQQYNLQ